MKLATREILETRLNKKAQFLTNLMLRDEIKINEKNTKLKKKITIKRIRIKFYIKKIKEDEIVKKII